VICSSCGTDNEDGRKYCGACAARLVIVCPACGAANSPPARFCGECAAPLDGGTGPSSAGAGPVASASIAERRHVSVLFADLVGFTALAAEQDPEEVRELLGRYFDLAREVIVRYGGSVEKFIGDAVMAVWGAPVAGEDDAESAVRAGLDLVDAVRSLGAGMEARAGVLTGEAAVTLGAVGEGMVAGDLVNTASRLQAAAPPGCVFVGETTHRAASRAIAFEPAGDLLLRGKTAPVPAWRAVRVVAERGGRRRADVLEPPFVGRDEELRLLKDLLHATGREKRARLVSVVGLTGIGKTRLAWELSKYSDGLAETIWWHEGRNPAAGDEATFWALGEMVRGRCALAETDDEATTRARVGTVVRDWVVDPAEARWVESALLALLGIDTSAIPSERLFGAWRTFFERIAARGTTVLVFEDLQWADSGLLDFIEHLLEWSRDVPLFVLTLTRPEFRERRPDWGVATRAFTSVHLDPLPEPAMRSLLAGLVEGLPPSTAATIVNRADGVPLYAVEMLRMLLVDGKLVRHGSSYRPVGDLGDLAVPETLTQLVAARLDGLSPDDRSILLYAAVLGQSFTTDALAAVSGLSVAALEPRLRSLVRCETLVLEADPRDPERGQHAFVQALIREVAYGTIARRDRVDRHLAAARYFESLANPELAGGVAGHIVAAYRLMQPGVEADALAARARDALAQAAERAAALASHDRALVFLEQALALPDDPASQADLLERAGEAASVAAHHDRAEAFLRRAVELHRGRGDEQATARALAALGRAMLDTWRSEAAIELLGAASADLGHLRGDPTFAALEGQLARACFMSGEDARALEVAERVLPTAERLDLADVVADTLVTKGSALGSMGRLHEAAGLLKAAIDLAQDHDDVKTLSRARQNLGIIVADRDPRAALELARANLAESRRLGWRDPTIASGVIWCALVCGEWDEAVAELDLLLATDLDREDLAVTLGNAIWIRAWRGEDVSASRAELDGLVAGRVDPTMIVLGDAARACEALAVGRLAEAAAAAMAAGRDYPAEATTHFPMAAHAAIWGGDAAGARAALDALAGTGGHTRVGATATAGIEAGLAAQEGRPADALARYRVALQGWRDLGMPVEQALATIDMATLLDPAEPEVQAAASEARDILTRLGARPFLERLDAAMARARSPARG
jgi:class 3 adenylate cyclase/tetratricopeptide (TPR) repeat protein